MSPIIRPNRRSKSWSDATDASLTVVAKALETGCHATPLNFVRHAPTVLTLSVHAPTDPKLLANADAAYVHCFDYGFAVDDSSPIAAQGFADLYNACGVSRCAVKPALQYAAELAPIFAVFAACELMDWPKFARIRENAALWSLAVAGVKEVQGLGLRGEVGEKMQSQTIEAGFAAALAAWEKDTLPLDQQEFKRHHPGGKVNPQDRQHLRACIAYGEAEGKEMASLKELLQRALKNASRSQPADRKPRAAPSETPKQSVEAAIVRAGLW